MWHRAVVTIDMVCVLQSQPLCCVCRGHGCSGWGRSRSLFVIFDTLRPRKLDFWLGINPSAWSSIQINYVCVWRYDATLVLLTVSDTY